MVMLKQKRTHKLLPKFNPAPYKVLEKKGSMITAENSVNERTRNSSQFKKINQSFEHSWRDEYERTKKSKKQESVKDRKATTEANLIILQTAQFANGQQLLGQQPQNNNAYQQHANVPSPPQTQHPLARREQVVCEPAAPTGRNLAMNQIAPQQGVVNQSARTVIKPRSKSEYRPHSERDSTSYNLRKPTRPDN